VTRYRIFLKQAHYAASTINLRLAAFVGSHTRRLMPASSVPILLPASGA
jgi:hypothetical protein